MVARSPECKNLFWSIPGLLSSSVTQFGFHPIIERWFASRFAGPTEPQVRGWPEIAAGRHTLISAPTGSGKTLTAFSGCDRPAVSRRPGGTLKEEMRVVYISPLRALSNDMQKNLSGPLEEICSVRPRSR